MKNEIWKDIKDYEGLYQVSNLGRVKSLDRYVSDINNNRILFYRGKLLKACDNGNEYQIVYLCSGGKRKMKYIHRLVAEAFILNISKLPYINHKDFNKQNNQIENLEWCTQKENINYSIDKGRFNKKSNGYNREYLCEIKNQIIEENNMGKTKSQIERQYKIDMRTLKKQNVTLKNWGTTGMYHKGKKVKCIETGEIFDSIKKANLKYGITTIKDCVNGRQKTSANLHWSFLHEEMI